ncbi:sugar kinase [Streptomyces sp. MA15]|uniref:sugar kinase n=1 Tax=Streptomyces sp. MA15 TaxID=3055061 RepID=UPI00339D40E7
MNRYSPQVIALGEVMLRFDSGKGHAHASRSLQVWVGGDEYNIIRSLRGCFGLWTAIVTALTDSPVGRIVEDLILQSGVDTLLVRWVPGDAAGHRARARRSFAERSFGTRDVSGVGARAGTAVSRLRKGDIDWDAVFADGTRWFHTGGVFACLSETTVGVAEEAMAVARRHGVTVSYTPICRPGTPGNRSRIDRTRETDLRLAQHADVVVGALGLTATSHVGVRTDEVPDVLAHVAKLVPQATVLATTLHEQQPTGLSNSSAAWSAPTGVVTSPEMPGLHVLDRIGSADGFAAGLIYGLLTVADTLPADLTVTSLQRALAYATAHGALGGFVWIIGRTRGRCPRCGVRPGRWSRSSRSGWRYRATASGG